MNLDRAVKDAFDPKQPDKHFPAFKKKFVARDSFRYPQGFRIEGPRVFLPKLGWISFRRSRPVEGTPRNITVSRKGSHWFVSIQTEAEVAEPVHPSESMVGIDRGVKRFATLSDGTFHEPLNAFRKMELKLAREQRKLARKTTRSNNWRKQKERITRLHIRTADMRNDYLHKLSTTISKNHAVVVLEDLKVKDMSASSRGTSSAPGKNVKQKTGLNKDHPRPGLGQLPVVPRIQTGATGRLGTLCQPGLYQPDLLGMRPHPPRQPQEPVRLRLSVLRVGDQRGPECRNQHLKGGARPVSLPSERCSNAVGNRNFKAGGLTPPVFGIPVSSGRGGCQFSISTLIFSSM